MKFTEEVIQKTRASAVFLDEPACSILNLTLDEIERLREALKKIVCYVPMHKTSWDLDDQAILDISLKALGDEK